MEPATQPVQATVHPIGHMYRDRGPVNLRISLAYQVPVVQEWPRRKPLKIQVLQPDTEHTNLTMVKLWFGGEVDVENGPGPRNITLGRKRSSLALTAYIRNRVYNSVPHAWPLGLWKGVCEFTDKWAVFSIQAMTHAVWKTEPKRRIVIP